MSGNGTIAPPLAQPQQRARQDSAVNGDAPREGGQKRQSRGGKKRGGRKPPGAVVQQDIGLQQPLYYQQSQPPQQQQVTVPAAAPLAASHANGAVGERVLFESLNVSAATKRVIREVLGFTHCTPAQSIMLPSTLQCGAARDVVAKAKTGSGKTLAFLIPALELLKGTQPGRGVSVLVISPTRELAAQIGEQAELLAKAHGLGVQVMVGGTNKARDVSSLRARCPDILVATPGRLNDHLEDSLLPRLLAGVKTLVLDEADRLLDMGFRPAIERMLASLPPRESRTTLLFSATFPANVQQLAARVLRPGHLSVDAVGESEAETNAQVEQHSLVAPLEQHPAVLWCALQSHMAQEPNYKVMVFFPTARVTQLYCEVWEALGAPVLEMHSRKSQSFRTRCADTFRSAPRQVMFSSDVSARGVDYPDVTLVVQVGLPSEAAQYVHRVGRTARAGKAGTGLLLLAPFEEHFLRQLSSLPVRPLSMPPSQELVQAQVLAASAMRRVSDQTKGQSYAAWLGYYNGFLRELGWSSEELVRQANLFAAHMGCSSPPGISPKAAGMMGLKGVPGVIIDKGVGGGGQQRGGGRGGGGRGHGGGGGGPPGGGGGPSGGGGGGRGRPPRRRPT